MRPGGSMLATCSAPTRHESSGTQMHPNANVSSRPTLLAFRRPWHSRHRNLYTYSALSSSSSSLSPPSNRSGRRAPWPRFESHQVLSAVHAVISALSCKGVPERASKLRPPLRRHRRSRCRCLPNLPPSWRGEECARISHYQPPPSIRQRPYRPVDRQSPCLSSNSTNQPFIALPCKPLSRQKRMEGTYLTVLLVLS